jgi:hypothetical protein
LKVRAILTYSTAIIIAANDVAVAVHRAVAHIGARMAAVIAIIG